MARCMLLCFIAVLACTTFITAANEQKFKCSSLKHLKNVAITEGEWITVNELLFEEGVPRSAGTGTSLRANTCIRHEVGVINATSITWTPIFSFSRGHQSRTGQLVVSRRPNGKWSVRSPNGRPGGRLLIVAGSTDRYIVRATCVPSGAPRRLLLKSVSVESRRLPEMGKRGALQAEELIEVKEHVSKILGMDYKPVHFGFFC